MEDSSERLTLFCDGTECPCEDKCCQECDDRQTCEKACQGYRYRERLYTDDAYLLEQLDSHVEESDNYLLAVVAEKLRSLLGIKPSDGGNP